MCGENHRITCHDNAELQTTTQTLIATKYSIESTYSDLPCDLKVNRGKFALINRPWKCKKGKGRRSRLVHSRKLAEHDTSPALFPAITVTVVRDRKNRTALRTNQIAGFVTVPSWKKNKYIYLRCYSYQLTLLRNAAYLCHRHLMIRVALSTFMDMRFHSCFVPYFLGTNC